MLGGIDVEILGKEVKYARCELKSRPIWIIQGSTGCHRNVLQAMDVDRIEGWKPECWRCMRSVVK
jgi:hypothetical protein